MALTIIFAPHIIPIAKPIIPPPTAAPRKATNNSLAVNVDPYQSTVTFTGICLPPTVTMMSTSVPGFIGPCFWAASALW